MTPDFESPVEADSSQPRLAWATPVSALYAVSAGAVFLAVAAFVTDEPAGRLLIVLAACGLAGLAVLGFRQRPRVAIRPGPDPRLVIGRLSGPIEYTPAQIVKVRVVGYRRLGRRMPMLEVDVRDGSGTESLYIFGRWDLGTHPEDVFEAMLTHGLVTH